MVEPQLSVRSAKARDIAHRLARRENRSIATIVELALEAYEMREAGREPVDAFYARIASYTAKANDGDDEVDLTAILDDNRKPHPGMDL
jgi:hypothetical protein